MGPLFRSGGSYTCGSGRGRPSRPAATGPRGRGGAGKVSVSTRRASRSVPVLRHACQHRSHGRALRRRASEVHELTGYPRCSAECATDSFTPPLAAEHSSSRTFQNAVTFAASCFSCPTSFPGAGTCKPLVHSSNRAPGRHCEICGTLRLLSCSIVTACVPAAYPIAGCRGAAPALLRVWSFPIVWRASRALTLISSNQRQERAVVATSH